jgi:hypothetical protein
MDGGFLYLGFGFLGSAFLFRVEFYFAVPYKGGNVFFYSFVEPWGGAHGLIPVSRDAIAYTIGKLDPAVFREIGFGRPRGHASFYFPL